MISNSVKKHITKLQQKKHRYQQLEYLVEGVHNIEEAIKSGEVLMIVAEGSRRDEKQISELLASAEDKKIPIEFCGRKDISAIKSTDTFPGVLAIVAMPEHGLEDLLESDTVICIDGVKDPGNLGTIIRTMDWFGHKSLLLSEGSVDPYNEKVTRSTMGAISRVQIAQSDDLADDLSRLVDQGYELISLDMDGKDISKLKRKGKQVLVFGSESHGIRNEILEQTTAYTIPKKGESESLNLAVAAGIVVAHISL